MGSEHRERERRRVLIERVASRAGANQQTVARYLEGRVVVQPSVARRIQRALAELRAQAPREEARQ